MDNGVVESPDPGAEGWLAMFSLYTAPAQSSIYSHSVVRAFGVRFGGLANWRARASGWGWVIANSLTCYKI